MCGAGRSKGTLSVPGICRPDFGHRCAGCGQTAWRDDSDNEQPSLVFLRAAAVKTVFMPVMCGGCEGKLEVDGREFGLLRKTVKLAFSHELLREWADEMATGGVPWHTMWVKFLQRLRSCSLDELTRYASRYYEKAFSEATMDFVDLQCLDYDAGFRCSCNAGEHCLHVRLTAMQMIIQGLISVDPAGYTADGMALGYHLGQAFLVSTVFGDLDATPVNGSLFKDRVFVRDKDVRELLLAYAGTGDVLYVK